MFISREYIYVLMIILHFAFCSNLVPNSFEQDRRLLSRPLGDLMAVHYAAMREVNYVSVSFLVTRTSILVEFGTEKVSNSLLLGVFTGMTN